MDRNIVSSGLCTAAVNTIVREHKLFKPPYVFNEVLENIRNSEPMQVILRLHDPKERQTPGIDSLSVRCAITFKITDNIQSFKFFHQLFATPKRVTDHSTVASLYGDEKFADFTFNVRGKSFKVHKNLLAAASDVFKTMFTCNFDVAKTNSAIEDCDPDVFKHFLKFIYTNEWDPAEMPSICCQLYKLAHRYNIRALMRFSIPFIHSTTIDRDNALDLYELASTYEIEKLLNKTWEFIRM